MEKRNRFFSFLKGNKKKSSDATDRGVLLGFGSGAGTSISEWGKQANSTYEACVHCLAKHISKIKPTAYYKDDINGRLNTLNRILNLRPNPLQTASEFFYTLADSYYRSGMALAHLVYDDQYNLTAITPLDISSMKITRSKNGNEVWLELVEGDGTRTYDVFENFIVLIRKANCSNPFLVHDDSIQKVVGALNANTDSFAKALAESHLIRYIAKMATVTDQKKQEALRNDFKKQLENDTNGLLIIPGVLDFSQIETSKGVFAKQPEIDDFRNEIFSHFGISSDFVKGKFSENDFQAVYENTLEPFINDLRQEMTYKLFTLREIGQGNEIRIETSPLQTASLATRISLANAIMSCGMYRPNDIMRLLYQQEIEGGDKIVQSLNYVDADKANQYQTGQPDDKSEDDDKDNKKKDDTEPDGDVTSNTQEGDQKHD